MKEIYDKTDLVSFLPKWRMFRTRNNILSIACVVATAALLESANAISYTFEIAVENAHDIIGPNINLIKFDGEIPSESDLTFYNTTNVRNGDIKNMFDSSIEDGNYIAWNKPIPVGTQLFTIEAESPVSEIEIVKMLEVELFIKNMEKYLSY